MRFRIVVKEHRVVREVWYVEADNADEAEEAHHNCHSTFDEEETVEVSDSYIDHVYNIDDPEGLLETDEGL